MQIECTLEVALPTWEARPYGVVSLEDIMKKFGLLQFTLLVSRIGYATDLCREEKYAGHTQISEMDRFAEIAKDMSAICAELGFNDSRYKADSLSRRIAYAPDGADYSGMHIEMMHLHESLILDMRKHKFLQVDWPKFLEDKSFLGDSVSIGFPKANEDILAAASCLSVDLNTAGVFHLMHIVEWGLRALCIHLGLTDVVVDKKNGKTVPIEFALWDRILNQLPEKVEAKVALISNREDRQKAQTLYYSLLEEVNGFKEAWRNHVMHTRAVYTHEDAIAIHSHVKRFMNTLALNGITES
jgi:hypothetical protein